MRPCMCVIAKKRSTASRLALAPVAARLNVRLGRDSTLAEDRIAFRVTAAEKQAEDGCTPVVLPDASLNNELAATDSKRVAGRRGYGVALPELRNDDR